MLITISDSLTTAHTKFFTIIDRHLSSIDHISPRLLQRSIESAVIDVKLMSIGVKGTTQLRRGKLVYHSDDNTNHTIQSSKRTTRRTK